MISNKIYTVLPLATELAFKYQKLKCHFPIICIRICHLSGLLATKSTYEQPKMDGIFKISQFINYIFKLYSSISLYGFKGDKNLSKDKIATQQHQTCIKKIITH